MTFQTIERAQHTAAKAAGALYLLQMATGVFGFYAHGRLMAPGDAVQTAKNIAASETFFRIGTVSDVMTAVLVVTLAWALYVVLRPIDRNLALLAAFFRVAENAIAAAVISNDFLALRLLSSAMYSRGFDTEELQVLARLFVGGQPAGLQIAFVFVGFGSAVFSVLWWKSRYIPRALAGLGIVASLLLALVTLIVIVLPDLGNTLGLSYMMPMGVYEVGLGLWLLIKGLREPVVE